MRALPRLALALALLAARAQAHGAEGPVLDDAHQASAWTPANADSTAPAPRRGDGQRWLRFDLPFSRLKDWRFNWDRGGAWNLSRCERVLVKARVGSDLAAGQALLYLKSGDGWYRLPAFSLTQRWREVALDPRQAAVEGSPSGWDHIEAARLSVLPGAGGDTWLDLAGIRGQRRVPDDWVWQVGGARNKERLFATVMGRARGKAFVDARRRLSEADSLLTKARRLGGHARRVELRRARAKAAQAWALAQRPLPLAPQGIRGVWVHNGDGPRGLGSQRAARWKDAIPEMAAQGINTVVANMLWSGVAFYPSQVVPNAPGLASDGDDLQQLLDAAHARGMKVIVWKVMWQFAEGWLAPPGVMEPFRQQGRLQLDDHGKELPWLCPCDPRNRQYELAALVEVATRYPIDGVQLDYIRFAGPDAGFGPTCKGRFEAATGKTVVHWPADCAPGGPLAGDYAAFKRGLISGFVRDASAALRAARPGISISAAVFPYAAMARDQVSQDWPRWVKEGWVDYVCPMTYTEDPAAFRAATRAQVALVGGDKVVAGIETTFDGGRVADVDSVTQEVQDAAALGTRGTVFFEWREQLQDSLLPYLRNGAWRQGPYDLKLRTVPPDQRPPRVRPGPTPVGEPKVLMIDDFEDGDLLNDLRSPWVADADSQGLGTRLDDQPLKPIQPGAHGSRYALELRGHFGANRPPWPYATLSTGFNPDHAPVDLSGYRSLVFEARGDGQPLEVLLTRASVKDYGDFKAALRPGTDWREFRVDLQDLAQPAWAVAVDRDLVDVTGLVFQPGSRDDQDFWFDIDDVRLER